MSDERKPQSADKYIVRFPDGMRDRIAEAAKANNRSMNAEIVARLQSSFDQPSVSMRMTEIAAPDQLSAAVQELQSLQRLGTLTYRLQRATYKADLHRDRANLAWHQLQESFKGGTPEEQAEARASYDELRDALEGYKKEAEAIEAEISAIHEERKLSGLKELRDVQPASVAAQSKFSDASKPAAGKNG